MNRHKCPLYDSKWLWHCILFFSLLCLCVSVSVSLSSGCSVSSERGGARVSAVVNQGPAPWFGRRLPAGLPARVQLQLWAGHQQHPGGPLGPQPGQTGPSHAKVTSHTLHIVLKCIFCWIMLLRFSCWKHCSLEMFQNFSLIWNHAQHYFAGNCREQSLHDMIIWVDTWIIV